MKNYFLQILSLAFAVCPMFSQQLLQLNDSSTQEDILLTAAAGKTTDESLLIEARKAYSLKVAVSTKEDEPVEADASFVYPNPTNGVIQLKLTGKITVYVYTLSGQFLRKDSMPPGEKMLDLSALGSGAYHIMAKSDDDYYSGNLIIQ